MSIILKQGATFERVFYCTAIQKKILATTSDPVTEGHTTIVIATGGTGSILAGDFIAFSKGGYGYKVLTGIADLSLGGSLEITEALESDVASGVKVYIHRPVDLTGFTARGQVRKKASSSDIAASFVCTIPTPANGAVVGTIPYTDTTAIPAVGDDYSKTVDYVYDIEIQNGTLVYRVSEGHIQVSPEVTK